LLYLYSNKHLHYWNRLLHFGIYQNKVTLSHYLMMTVN
jgi:hypothetical protein